MSAYSALGIHPNDSVSSLLGAPAKSSGAVLAKALRPHAPAPTCRNRRRVSEFKFSFASSLLGRGRVLTLPFISFRHL
jgi:hypothetical protein